MMKKHFTLLLTLLTTFFCLYAAPPTVPSSGLQFPAANIDGNRFTMTFNKGNGAFRIIVVKAGSPVNSLPVNGREYTGNSSYGQAGTEFAPGDGFVVFRGSHGTSSASQQVSNLQAGTVYHVAVFEYNGTGVTTEYLSVSLTGNVSTLLPPTVQSAITSFTAISGNRLTVNFSGGNGERKLLVARKGGPVNAVPANLTDYPASGQFGNGSVLNTDNYVVYKGGGNSATITNLEPNTVYHFSVFDYNGNSGPVYLIPGGAGSQLTNTGPTQATSAISFNGIEGNRVSTSFSPGNGRYQLIVMRQGQPVTAIPVNGQTYTASTAFGAGQQIAPGEFVMNALGTDKTFTNLLPSTMYYIRIYDFDMDAAGNTYYLTTAYGQNNSSTATAPTVQASNVSFENITGSTLTIRHVAGNGALRLVVMKQGSPVDAVPANLTAYNGNTVFGLGPQINPGNYVMNGGQNGTSLNVSGLTPGLTYHVAVFGYNGNNYPVYAVPGATGSITIPNEPGTPGTNMSFSLLQGNAFRAQWAGGDGSRRIVIARKNTAVTAIPVDGASYTANPVFGSGTEIAPGQFVIYNDVNRVVDLQNLEIGTTYHLAVFEYNVSAAGPDYLVSAFLAGNTSTYTAPTVQTTGLSASGIQSTQVNINYTAGNGTGRLLIMRAGSPVNVIPQDLVNYTYSGVYGTQEIGTGNYVVLKASSGSNASVTGLQPNTEYYVRAFEYNGSSGPVYLNTASSFSFTTTAGAGTSPPTVNATAASFSLIDGNQFTFNWTNGDGARRMVVMRQGSPVSFSPVNGMDYAANASFGSGTDLAGGQYTVFNGAGNTVAISNLLPATTYYFAVFEYNGTAAATSYLTAGTLTSNRSTAVTPASGSTLLAGTVAGLTININWTNGPGSGRIVVMKEGSAVNNVPAALSKYPAGSVFQAGSQIATGEYVVYAGSGNTVTVTGLQANKTYHYKVFEYNGIDAPVYNTTNVSSNSSFVPSTLPLRWLYVNTMQQNTGITVQWGTAQEMNVSHFVIERSNGNGNFTAIDNIPAKGNAVQNDYRFTDAANLDGIVYYRIRQVDIDGRSAYSPQVRAKANEVQAAPRLYPVPAKDFTTLSLPNGTEKAAVTIYDMSGKPVLSKTFFNGEKILLTGLQPGVYQVQIADKKTQCYERLIIQ